MYVCMYVCTVCILFNLLALHQQTLLLLRRSRRPLFFCLIFLTIIETAWRSESLLIPLLILFYLIERSNPTAAGDNDIPTQRQSKVLHFSFNWCVTLWCISTDVVSLPSYKKLTWNINGILIFGFSEIKTSLWPLCTFSHPSKQPIPQMRNEANKVVR